jgi:pSer/pThr/pTyr-binding forkhead associated (FHA) protein
MSNSSPEAFWQACAAQGSLRLSVKRPGQPGALHQALGLPYAVIGRDSHVSLQLDDAKVSRRHAYVQLIGGQLFVMDLGSKTGIRSSGGPLQAAWLPQRERIGIGPFWLRWHQDALGDPGMAADYHPLTQVAPGATLAPLALEFLNGQRQHRRWQVNRAVTLIGSTDACKVCLRSPRVSPFHCSLVWSPEGAWVVDLLGRDGVRVNGVPVRFARLEHDDRLQVGEFVIRVCCDAPADTPPPTNPATEPTRFVTAAPTPWSPPPADQPASQNGALMAAVPQGKGDLAESLLVPLISQFGAMQQQMADQFRQTLAMMFQMFGALHRDQMTFIQEEMDRLQQLNRELHLLQIEAATHPPAQAPASTPRPAAGPESRPRPVAAGAAADRSPRMAAEPPNSPAPPPRPTAATGAVPAAPCGEDVHTWLCRRMAAVEEERQSRWQKLLGLLAGKRAEVN